MDSPEELLVKYLCIALNIKLIAQPHRGHVYQIFLGSELKSEEHPAPSLQDFNTVSEKNNKYITTFS